MSETPNAEIALAREIIENTDTNLFLTGKAGTGKTTFLRHLRSESPKRMVVLAPTGIAAINAGGVTIHSFFQLSFAPFVPGSRYPNEGFKMTRQKLRLIRSIDLLVIDEVSMVRADLLDAVDATLRRYRDHAHPFGGVQLLLIGDLQQLAPVVKEEEWAMLGQYYDSPFFFASKALQQTNYATIELKTVYRQSDEHFLLLLNAIREGKADEKTLLQLNSRCLPAFTPNREDGYIRLVTHNHQAHQVNNAELEKIDAPAREYKAIVKGKFPEMSYPTDEVLVLKKGAQVMFVKNDTEKRYFNGMIGEVVELNGKSLLVRPEGADDAFEVFPESWTNSRYAIDERTKEIKEEVEGEFVQIPLRLAWAITIHKSQGLTFDRVIIDASLAFAHGQTYVALSRCRTLQGIVLNRPLTSSSVILDSTVEGFTNQMYQRCPQPSSVEVMRREFAIHLLTDLFSFINIRVKMAAIVRHIEEHLYRLYPESLAGYKQLLSTFDMQMVAVASRFALQYGAMLGPGGLELVDEALQGRIKKGADYFYKQLIPVYQHIVGTNLPTDNKEVERKLTEIVGETILLLRVKSRLLKWTATEGFATQEYMKKRARVALEEESGPKVAKSANASARGQTKKERPTVKTVMPAEVKNRVLFAKLNTWRAAIASKDRVPVYMVLQQKALMAICANQPENAKELLAQPNVGKTTVEKYGEDILKLVKESKK